MTSNTQKRWAVKGPGSFDSLQLDESAPIAQLGDVEVLVKFYGAALNSRDLQIAQGNYPFPSRDGVVPGSDGAGVIEKVGSKVSRFKPGDKVVTLFNQGLIAGSLDSESMKSGTGGVIDGSLQQYGAYNEQGLVKMPSNLNFSEAATLTCAGLTAWNALYGLRPVIPGDWVIVQGTGGVSLFALQFAKAAGAKVIATTSSKSKEEKLKALGADHVLNYKDNGNWGEEAKDLTTDGIGAQHIIEVGGSLTMAHSLKAIAYDGVISVIGYLSDLGSGGGSGPSYLGALTHGCIVRGVIVGSRLQFEEMNRAIESNLLKPVLDPKIFKLAEVRKAYQYMADQKHFGKICIEIE